MKKRTLSLILTVCMLFTSTASMQDAEVNNWKDKINANVWVAIDETPDSDSIPVWLWLKGVDDAAITKTMIREKGFDPAVYEDENRFNKEIVPKISLRSGRAVNAKFDEYVVAKREIVSREYSKANNDFIKRNLKNKNRKILYNSRFTSTLVLEATKAEIEAYAKNQKVEEISLFVDMPLTPEMDVLKQQINADDVTGTKSPLFNSGSGYKGNGVNIGILEATGA